MRRASSAIASSALLRSLLSDASSSAVVHPRLLQVALYRTADSATTTSASSRSQWFRSFLGSTSGRVASVGVAGTLLTVAGATVLFEEAYAKERVPSELAPKEVILYQYEACPFCNKVKAFLDYYDIQYKVVEVNPLFKTEIKWSDYKKVPILMVDGERLVDSSAIIDKLGSKIIPGKSFDSVPDDDEEKIWRRWVDGHLVHVLSPNIYRNPSEALESFEYITSSGEFSYLGRIAAKYVGATAMYYVSKRLKKKHNITDERAALYEAAETWVNALNGRDFLGGSKPNLADLAAFGVLKPIRYLKSGIDMVENTRIGEWYTRMEGAVGKSSRINA